jgi:hypothetical protein
MPRPGSTTQRGYGTGHQAERARWQARLDRGETTPCHSHHCLHPGQPIDPDPSQWDLGHNADRTAWTGPEHIDCNRSAGGRNGAMVANAKRTMTIREW